MSDEDRDPGESSASTTGRSNRPSSLVDFRVRPPFKSFLDVFSPASAPADNSKPSVQLPHVLTPDEPPSRVHRSLDLFIDEMDAAGIALAVAMGRACPAFGGTATVENADVAELAALYPRRFVGFGGVDTSDPAAAVQEARRCKSLGLVGIALDNPLASPPRHNDDSALFPLYEYCEAEGLLVSLTSSFMIGPDISFSEPAPIQRVALRFPGLRILVAHAAYPYALQACVVAMQCRNVHLLPDVYLNRASMPGRDIYIEAARAGIEDQMLYASSYPAMALPAAADAYREAFFDALPDSGTRMLGVAERLLGRPVDGRSG